MLIGIPKEIKNHEYRVGATAPYVKMLCQAGHQVIVQKDAGKAIGHSDSDYIEAGAKVVPDAKSAYDAEMVIKVKEPQPEEYPLLKENQILFCYLHLAPDPQQTEALVKQKVIAIAYETVLDNEGKLPLLTPMSEIAGRISVQAGATALQMIHGGKGVLLGGVPGVHPAKVIVIGGGVVGTQAARMAFGLGADVTLMDRNMSRLRDVDETYRFRIRTLFSTPHAVEQAVKSADLVIGAVLVPGAKAPKLVTRDMLKQMEPGSVLVDVAIDQGGCFETSKPTTHSDPTYIVDDIVHYCVTNMPGACAKTATVALTNVTFSYALSIADKGWQKALKEDPLLCAGLNTCQGHITNQPVADALNLTYTPAEKFL